jgi:ribose/xylose/arabinose/galactoside ABC-type transport system permease subunit
MSQDFHGDVGQVAGEKIVNKGGKTRLELHIQGDNYGHISVGSERNDGDGYERPIHLFSKPELYEALRYWRAQWWGAHRAYWLNIPTALLLSIIVGLCYGLLNGALVSFRSGPTWEIVIPLMLAMFGCMAWLANIRRVESLLIAESGSAIDFIQAELRKRR